MSSNPAVPPGAAASVPDSSSSLTCNCGVTIESAWITIVLACSPRLDPPRWVQTSAQPRRVCEYPSTLRNAGRKLHRGPGSGTVGRRLSCGVLRPGGQSCRATCWWVVLRQQRPAPATREQQHNRAMSSNPAVPPGAAASVPDSSSSLTCNCGVTIESAWITIVVACSPRRGTALMYA